MPFKKGIVTNPNGRPRKPEIALLREAIEATEIEQKKSLWKHLVERAYKDDGVLKALSNKFVPDMTTLSIDPQSNKIIVEFKK